MSSISRAVLFDAGGTLMHVRQSVGHVYAAVARKYGVDAAPDDVEAAFRRVWETRRDTLHETSSDALERQWWHALVTDVFAAVGKLENFRGSFDAFFHELNKLFSTGAAWRVFDDVDPALSALERLDVRRAVVSNWDSSLPQLLDALGLRRWFEFVLTSAEARHRKPDPRIFEQAVARLGLHPDQVLHVGDSYEDDFVGAQAAGLRCVIVDRHGSNDAICPTIETLTELPGMLEGNGARPQ